MKKKLFNHILSSIRNYATMESSNRFQVPLTPLHRLSVVYDWKNFQAITIDLVRIDGTFSNEVAIYCRSCPQNLIEPEQVEEINYLLKTLHDDAASTEIVRDFSNLMRPALLRQK